MIDPTVPMMLYGLLEAYREQQALVSVQGGVERLCLLAMRETIQEAPQPDRPRAVQRLHHMAEYELGERSSLTERVWFFDQ